MWWRGRERGERGERRERERGAEEHTIKSYM